MATGTDRQADQHGTYPFDLGSYRRTASTSSAEAGRWFDRGLIWSYAFNHEEAIACFERAIAADPKFAMAYWGLAYAAGPNYNKQWDASDEDDLRASLRRSREAAVRAAALAAPGTRLERDLIGALEARCPSEYPDGDLDARNVAYADAMGEEVAMAADVYAADLGLDATLPRACRHPNNVWSLHGYHECLVRLGRAEQARALRPQLDRALARADVAIESSCFCRVG